MTKSELKTGMVLIMKNGDICMVFKDVDTEWAKGDVIVEINANDWESFDNYNENLKHNDHCCSDWDIMKIYKQRYAGGLRGKADYGNEHLLWERPKSYTYEELKEILGHDFELVG